MLTSDDALTALARRHRLHSWSDVIKYTHQLPYGRNSNREDFSLVLTEQKGTCSSKHALLKLIADANNIPEVQLILCLYKMSEKNTPNIGTALSKVGLSYIPEAHCYLNIEGIRLDITKTNSTIESISIDIIQESEISPDQVSDYKVAYHKNYIKHWLQSGFTPLSFEEVWEIREQCISNLSTII